MMKSITSLPRTPSEAGVVVVQLKRKKNMKNSYLQQYINVGNILKALEYLKEDFKHPSYVDLPDDMDASLKPYQLQPSGQNLDAVRASITDKVEAINRMSHMGAVRGTEAMTMSGVAMQTEFQMLNAKLAEKADLLELAEEQLWLLFCDWQDVTPDVEIFYPDAFDLRDYDKELMFLQQLRSTGVKSVTLSQEIDKKIADLLLDDEQLAKSHVEIESGTQVLGQFNEQALEIGS